MATVPSNPAFAPTLSTRGRLNGILFVALFAVAVTQLAALPAIANLGISPLIVGIVAGALYGNALRDGVPASWAAGINFSARGLLRIAVAFFGLRVSLQEIAEVGWSGLIVSVLVVTSTLLIGLWCGMKVFKLDRDTALLTAAGSAICGAAAVLAFESALRSAPHKSAMQSEAWCCSVPCRCSFTHWRSMPAGCIWIPWAPGCCWAALSTKWRRW